MGKKKIGLPAKSGPKIKHFKAISPELIKEVEEMSADGMTQFHIAGYFGMHQSTWFERCKIFPELSEAYFRGKSKGVKFVTGLLKKLMEDGNERAIMFYLKNVAKFSEIDTPERNVNEDKDKPKTSLATLDLMEAS